MMSSDGWRMPAEWEPQEATWLTWPSNPETWPRARTEIEEFFVGFVRLIACFQPLRIVAAHDYHPQIQKMLGNMKDVELVPVPSNDAWCRDHGPTFVLRDNGKQLGAVDWKYNAWGGKFPPWDDDDAVPERVAAMLGIERIPAPFFCEGGAIETDGEGNLLTTESVLLNDNRNGEGGRMEIETFFSGRLGVGRVVWLPDGLVGDDTDGHVDMIARFAPDNILLVASASPGNQSRRILDRNRAKLVHAFPGHTILDLPLARTVAVPDPMRTMWCSTGPS